MRPREDLPQHYQADLTMDLLDVLTDRTIFDTSVTGCWLWGGTVTSWGYGTIGMGGRTVSIHRRACLACRRARGRKKVTLSTTEAVPASHAGTASKASLTDARNDGTP